MPVVDTPVHEKVKQKEGFRYGCWNLARYSQPYLVQERKYYSNGWFELEDRWIDNVMSGECRFDMSLKDSACEGCEHRGSGEKYAEEIRRNGK